MIAPSEALKNSLENIRVSMQKLVIVCQSLGMPFVNLLRPGQSRERVLQMWRPISLSLPSELIDFYEVCDGVDESGHTVRDSSVFYAYSFLPLQRAIDIYLDFQQKECEEIDKAWFPLLKSGRDYYFVDCDKAERHEPYIIGFMAESGADVEYQSIRAMLDTFADCYKESAFVVAGGEITDYNDEKQVEVAFRHNPKVEFWQQRHRRH